AVENTRVAPATVQRVLDTGDVADRVGAGKRDHAGAEHRSVQQYEREEGSGGRAEAAGQPVRDRARVDETTLKRGARERERAGSEDRDGANREEHRPDQRVYTLVRQPASADSLVDHVRLMEEQLPGRNSRPHQRD